MKAFGIRRLVLQDYRSYRALDLAVAARTVVVTGDNGSGKTNLLEAISLFAQGRGLRRADFAACARQGGSGGFAASIDWLDGGGPRQFGTAFEPGLSGEPPARRFRVDREPVGSARAFAAALRIVWLVPAMDGLFAGSPGERRRFLDRLVLALDAEHGARVAGLERALRQRNRVLDSGGQADSLWLDAIEREAAELAVAVAVARTETVARLAGLLGIARDDAFPRATLAVAGEVEGWCADATALAVEDRYRLLLKANRAQDAAAGRATVGPHTADLRVTHAGKATDAALCSTGEQKALLIGLVLAHARLVAAVSGLAPVILLDEIAAHLDEGRRRALFAELDALSSQVWMTGADASAFAGAGSDTQMLRVTPGFVSPA